MNIYLAGDSIVQNYTEEEFIAGWGQFLPRFFKPDVNVFNYAKGGRSSRLFINEGRFEEIDRHIQSGDYLFIEFCHNDDDSKDYKSMFNRQTPLGVPDESGRFPVIAGVKMPKNYIPPEYIEALNNDDSITDKQAVLNSVLAINQRSGGGAAGISACAARCQRSCGQQAAHAGSPRQSIPPASSPRWCRF